MSTCTTAPPAFRKRTWSARNGSSVCCASMSRSPAAMARRVFLSRSTKWCRDDEPLEPQARCKRASHSRNSRSIFCALSKFLAEPSPIGATSLADASSAARKSAPATVAPVRLAPPNAAPLSEALVRSAFRNELCALHLCCEDIRASETRSAQIGFQKPPHAGRHGQDERGENA